MSGARPFPVSRHVLASPLDRSGGKLGRGPEFGGDWVVDCIIFFLHFLVWCFTSLFLFCVVFFDEGWVEMLVHAKKGA